MTLLWISALDANSVDKLVPLDLWAVWMSNDTLPIPYMPCTPVVKSLTFPLDSATLLYRLQNNLHRLHKGYTKLMGQN